jgi:hypothetical protein
MPDVTPQPAPTPNSDAQDEPALRGLKLDDPDIINKITERVYQLFLNEARIEHERAGRNPGNGKK